MDLYNWNLFCKDGNIKHLNNITYSGLEIIKSFINKNVKYKALQHILKLYFNNNIKNSYINTLTDIISLSYHELNGIKIYIFGEHHYPTNKCSLLNPNRMSAFDFIKSSIENIPKFIDIFTETSYITKEMREIKWKSNTLAPTLIKFENEYEKCLSQNPELNKCLNIRFHNTDIRLIISKRLLFVSYIHNLMFHIHRLMFIITTNSYEQKYITELERKVILEDYIKYLYAYKIAISDPKNSEEIRNYMNAKSSSSLINMYINIYDKIGKFNKQLLRLDSYVKDILEKYMLDKFNQLDFNYINFNNIYRFMNTLPINTFPNKYQLKELELYTKYNILLESIFMDVYLMARIFRNFDKKEYQYSESPSNIIIYVGNTHAENYREILYKLKFKELFKKEAKYNEFCVDISKLKQPLFM